MSFRARALTVPEQIAELYEKIRALESGHSSTAVIAGDALNRAFTPGPPGDPGPAGSPGPAGDTGPAGTASVVVRNEGAALGVFDSINFVGSAVHASLVGDAATVTVTASSGSDSDDFSVIEDARYRMLVGP